LQDISRLVGLVKERFQMKITVETNGTAKQPFIKGIDLLTISPKMSNSGQLKFLEIRVLKDLLKSYNCQLKFVIEDIEKDVSEAMELVDMLETAVPVVLQPQGMNFSTPIEYLDFLRNLWNYCKTYRRDVRCLPQLHVLLFGRKRGI